MNALTREFPDFDPQLAPEATLDQVPTPARGVFRPPAIPHTMPHIVAVDRMLPRIIYHRMERLPDRVCAGEPSHRVVL